MDGEEESPDVDASDDRNFDDSNTAASGETFVLDEASENDSKTDDKYLDAKEGEGKNTELAENTIIEEFERAIPSLETESDQVHYGTEDADLISRINPREIALGLEGDDNISTYDEGSVFASGDAGDDTLHGYYIHKVPDGSSYYLSDSDADTLEGGQGDDMIRLGPGDYGSGGAGNDIFAMSDVENLGAPVEILDFNPEEDSILIEAVSGSDGDLESHFQITESQSDGQEFFLMIDGQVAAIVKSTKNALAHEIKIDYGE